MNTNCELRLSCFSRFFCSAKFFALEASGVLSSRFAIAECVATPEKVGCCPHSCHHIKIAVIKPVFTTTAYSSFYTFYSKYAKTPPGVLIKTDLNLLNACRWLGL
ncbi:hypothetical protein B9Q02_03570 [Candidatus Marsarchaeota G1 archaeon BE_D]|uniref:Uncharacterized protein n=1 Tax=Candidatus Marsarchaeota G1 archaeon BE_D TaxID=1978156 RepID=A0A2R6AID9_9ARCH|nr:MAG: hypothetical protein B9Q02_03570 [Candidatus Marsarchaeota G1 archaeon BE_D]